MTGAGLSASISYPWPTGTTSRTVFTGHGNFLGFSLAASDAGADEIRFHDGLDATGPLIGIAKAAASGTGPLLEMGYFPEGGIRCNKGLFVEVVSGSPEGAIYYR
jgi:hypothetical protein